MTSRICGGVVAMIIATAATVRADDAKARADVIYQQGEALYAAKNYLAAASHFEEAYALDPDPAVLFNIAQAYRFGRACAQAARYYHLFVDKVPHPPDAAGLARNMNEMDTCAKAEASAAPPTVIHDTRVVHHTKIVRSSSNRAIGLGLGIGGLVSLAVGAWFTHDVHAIQAERDVACPAGCIWAAAGPRIAHLDDRGRRAQLGEAIAYSAGAAALITGVLLVVFSRDETRSRELLVTPTATGAAASWRF